MATLLELENLRADYLTLADVVTREGEQVAPRGLPVIELTDVTFTVHDLADTLPVGVGRELSLTVAAIEALQLLAGTSTPDLLVAVAPQFANYREPDGHFHGAYGSRVDRQLIYVVEKLRRDPDTRQAVLTLWDPRLDNQWGHHDYPCTVALGFRLRGDRLHLSVLMRSNDLWLGTAYDVFQFTQLQWSVAHELGVEPGTYTHTAWSLHLYERDLPRIAKLHPPRRDPPWSHPTGIRPQAECTGDELADDLLFLADTVTEVATHDPSVAWYLERVRHAYDMKAGR